MSLTAKATTASASALTTVTELGTGSDLGGVVAALYAATAHDQHKNKTVPLPLLRVAPTSLAHASLVAAAAVHVPGIAIMLATHESNIFEPLAGRVPILLIQYNPLPDLHSLPPIAYSYSESLEFSLEAIESALPKNSPFFKYSGPLTPSTVLVIPGTAPFLFESAISENQRVGILRISVQRPWSAKHLLATIPTSATNIAVLDFVSNFSNAFGTIFLDVAASSATSFNIKEIRVHGEISENVVANILKSAISVFDENAAFMNLHGDIVNSFANVTLSDVPSKEIDIEGPYVSLLNQIFKDRLNLSNVISEASVLQPEIDLKPKQIVSTARSRFIEQAKSLVASSAVSKGVTNPLKAWLQAQEPDSNNASNSVSLGRKAHDALGAARSYQQELSDFYEESGAHLLSPPTLVTATNKAATTPASKNGKLTGTSAEFGLGLHLSQLQERDRFIIKAQEIVASKTLPTNASAPLEAWIAAQTIGTNIATTSTTHGQEAYKHLSDVISTDQSTKYLRDFYQESAAYLLTKPPSRWILGGDALTHDIGASGVHHVVASKSNVNILILDTQPYSEKKNSLSPDTRRKDIGLYAMTYGGVYVASVALQSSFAGVVRALTEADAFNGPSVVVAYAPRVSTAGSASGSGVLVKGGAGLAATAALAALKETKQAVDEGYWPLYRWTPSAFGESSFCLDSEKMRGELEVFLERDRHISLIAAAEPTLELVPSVEKELQADVEAKIKDSYAALVANLNTTPVLILYGSDGGAAAGAAKRLVAEAKQRGLKPKLSVMDEYSVEDFVGHEHVVFVVSTAGQGEFPGNSRETWKALQGLKKGGEVDFGKMRYAVFAMGDSHYWPLPSDAHFFCKSGKDLDAKLEALGAPRLVSIGIGNDRDADGWQTGYKLFAADLWASLGVDFVEVSGPAVMVGTDDAIKEASNFLRGTIAPGLEDTTTGSLAELDQRLTKFHGIYQQDDRDIRESRLRAGLEAAYSFMVRVRVPGGVATPAQWVAIDNVSNKLANGTIKLTTRQAFQFHGIVKSKLKKAIQEINHALMDTLAACGDVNRNVMCNPNPSSSNVHAQVLNFSRKFSAHLTPNTNAYHEIWLDKKMVVTSEDVEPIYGKTYLPRKFKVAVAVPPYNDVDVFAHDLGYISIVDGDNLIGFNVTVGGGMGMTHSMNTTYPRLGDLLGFCTIEQAVNVGEKVVLVQRDFGDRTNRKHARLKYTIDDRGIDWFRNEVEQRLGYKLQPARPYTFISNGDRYGWSQGAKGTWAYTLFIQNGRVKDEEARMMKSGLRTIADDFVRRNVEGIEFRLTPNQHLMIAGVPAAEKWKFEAFLRKYELENGNLSGLRQHSMACVALPTCGLAMAESERYLPDLISLIENVLEVNGLRDDAITIRMTGCPNGCARPQIAEIAFIGKAPGTYNMYLGGGHNGERLNKIYKENLTERDIISELTPIIEDYAKYRANGEHFGDFVIRKNYVKATTSGKHFHDVEKLPTKVESTGQNGVLKIFAGGGSWIGLAFAETPPGELQEVLNDIRVLVNNNEDFVQEAIAQPLAEYSISSFLVIETDPATNSKIILTKHNQLEDGRFVDQKSATSFAVDHVTQTTSDPQPHDSPSHIEDHRKALELAIASYTEDHYPEGFSAVYSGEGKTLVACIVSNKFNPTNFWNGRWISEWTVSLDFDDVKGDVRAHVHYYEDGNVQLKASKQLSVKRSATEIDPTSFAASVVKVILKAETDYQMALNVTYSQISDTTFKSLRRALPITRTKFDWNSVSNYKIGAELSNK